MILFCVNYTLTYLCSRKFKIIDMKLHIFNPEHDLALAQNDKFFTAPHAARVLRNDLSFLPFFWAEDGDLVFVDDLSSAQTKASKFQRLSHAVQFVDKTTLAAHLSAITAVEPWGWDTTICQQMRTLGLPSALLPTDTQLSDIRQMSHRKFAVDMLSDLRTHFSSNNIIGKSRFVTNMDELRAVVSEHPMSVIKAPWSSSGRGIRYVERNMDVVHANWANNVIHRQGGIVVEPYYNKVRDFALEFSIVHGKVSYLGLSLFQTVNGSYTGNLIASESVKREILGEYIDLSLFDAVVAYLLSALSSRIGEGYEGVFGIDMMVVANPMSAHLSTKSFLLHPFVELNLRRTMGHVALSAVRLPLSGTKIMHIDFDGLHHHLQFKRYLCEADLASVQPRHS